MLVLGLQGSPRKNGNTDYFLKAFMNEAEKSGVKTHTVEVAKKNIQPCRGCGFCEKHGKCVIDDDDMTGEIYSLLRQADVIVAATPVFFYSATAQLKALIDRSQTLWSRKYKLNVVDPGRKTRQGFLLSIGATKGKNLFDGLKLTMKYFYDATGAGFHGSLTYRRIENKGDIKKHPTVLDDIQEAAGSLLKPFLGRKKIIFACIGNTCRSQMASAFAQSYAGDRIEALSGGSKPEHEINPVMVEAMGERGIDMAFRKTQSLESAISQVKPDMIITMGCGEECPYVPGATVKDWEVPDPAGKSMDFMRTVRDEIKQRVEGLIKSLT
ncbi:MAG: NAD(P)H-dependent oxidoreductase [Thermodesulfobacteriota bacterium]|nr:NAD(P)H-dependent oxidoreductase [Thermodesulfobacteriota bacterium]